MITLITSQIRNGSPDISLLQNFEQYCSGNSNWRTKTGPVLFAPRSVSSRIYTAVHTVLKPILKNYKMKGAVVSLGLPYHIYLYSKNFPYFTFDCDLRVLWTYDVWEPDFQAVEQLVRESGVNLLLLSSFQATEHFKSLRIPGCQVHWVPETINPDDYKVKPWDQRSINVLSFGRSWHKYHDLIVEGCKENHINYAYQERNENTDVAVQGLRKNLQFPTWPDFVNGLADSQICLCFPRTLTHPDMAGSVSTLTIRYLQAMASKCLVLGSAPLDAQYLFDYNPVVEVDWKDPVGQIKEILSKPEQYSELIERNYRTVCNALHHRSAVAAIERLVNSCLAERRPQPASV